MNIEVACPRCGRTAPPPCPFCADPVNQARVEATQTNPTGVRAEPKEQIVCPRCQLHFSPRRHRKTVSAGERPRILVVEEAGFFLDTAQEALSGEYEVVTAANATEAAPILDRGGFAVLVLGVSPDRGFANLELLRGRAKPCPVLMYTEADESEVMGEKWEEVHKLGADDIVIKGMNVGEALRRKVGALLGRQWDDEEDIA